MFGFSSKFFDPESGFSYYGYRYYNSSAKRWLNRDPLGEVGGLNIYNFVYNCPIALVDPTGLDVGGRIGPGFSDGYLNLVFTDHDREVVSRSKGLESGDQEVLSAINPLQTVKNAVQGLIIATVADSVGLNPDDIGNPSFRPITCPGLKQRTPAENRKARNKYKNNKDEAREVWERRTGQKWPTDEYGNPWPGHHEPPLKEGGDPLYVVPQDPGGPDPHNIPGPDGKTDYQRWGELGPAARGKGKK